MVAYLKKPTGSEGFQEIVDFLNGSHIRYALTKNPTIYVSLIKKFWLTATVRTVDNGEQEINATVDGKEFTITEASIRRHLQLADADGISVLPNTKIFDQLALMGYVLTDDKLTFQKDEVVHQERGDSIERADTTATSLEAVPRDHGGASAQTRFERASKLSYDSPLGGDRVLALETDLRQTKKVYGTIYTKLIMKLKKLEKTVKTSQARRRAKIVVSAKVLADAAKVHTYSRRRRAVSTGSGGVSTAGMIQQVNIIISSSSATKDKGKAIMTKSELEQITKKLKQRQERAGYEAAIRLQEQLNEEESQWIARDA
ncbi:hypothetical protein Tco_1452533, partial [Tanacetum coccineum]